MTTQVARAEHTSQSEAHLQDTITHIHSAGFQMTPPFATALLGETLSTETSFYNEINSLCDHKSNDIPLIIQGEINGEEVQQTIILPRDREVTIDAGIGINGKEIWLTTGYYAVITETGDVTTLHYSSGDYTVTLTFEREMIKLNRTKAAITKTSAKYDIDGKLISSNQSVRQTLKLENISRLLFGRPRLQYTTNSDIYRAILDILITDIT